jgi:RNA polymerase sigma-70 factor (ECF subfamily)|tara:strand:- start:5611 stop:6189 length:579 start_codon:yes stop_codon:yes gene_type:complete
MAESDHFLDVFINLQRRLARLVMGIVPPRDVEDIVQETYVRVCQVKNKGAIRDLHSFMFRTAKNLALDHIKRAESRLTEGVDEIDSIQTSELDSTYAQVVSDEEFVLFCEAVRELPKQSRRAFILKKVYGYTLKEIMAEMGLGQATVETHIVNGTKKCVQYMRDRQEQPAGRHLTSRNSNAGSSRRRPGGEL